jgi:hypothetical protein
MRFWNKECDAQEFRGCRRRGYLLEAGGVDCGGESAQLPVYPLRNFSASIFIEYLARDSLGNYFLATRATNDWDGTLIIDFGQPGDMAKEQFYGIARGSSSRISFAIDGQQAIAYFPDMTSGAAYLQIGGVKRSLEIVQPAGQIMNALGFDCWSKMRYYGYL